MAGPRQTAFYKTPAWKHVQKAYMRKPIELADGRICPALMCERCYERYNRLTPANFVHHIEHLDEEKCQDPQIALSYSNLMRVCRDCHTELHYPGTYEPRVAFDSNGRVIPIEKKDYI